jgi:hypothetical protein
MLSAFIAAANGAELDARLSPHGAVAAASLSEALRGRYLAHQAGWLEQRLGEPFDPALQYALIELSGDPGVVTAAWPAMDSAGLKALLANGPLRIGAGYDR